MVVLTGSSALYIQHRPADNLLFKMNTLTIALLVYLAGVIACHLRINAAFAYREDTHPSIVIEALELRNSIIPFSWIGLIVSCCLKEKTEKWFSLHMKEKETIEP